MTAGSPGAPRSSPADARARAEADGVLGPLPRRARLRPVPEPTDAYRTYAFAPIEVPFLRVIGRAVRWAGAGLRLALGVASDRIRGRDTLNHRAVRVRQLFEHMGGTAIKVGQQMAVRVDFLPFEVCQELNRLMDRVPPFPVAYAVERLEALTGRPLAADFEELEETPIGSASVACVFRGTLKDGAKVAVKVRRPDAMGYFVADLRIVGWATRLLEGLTIVRPDFFKYLRRDLQDMFMDEMDFQKEAIHQRMFRRYARRDHIRWLDAPAVYTALSGADVLTSEFVVGYSCQDILDAVDTGDVETLSLLRGQGIDPRQIGNRILQIGFWFRFECPFFHADPHPGNILVRPGGELVMLDFGACGIMLRSQAEQQIELIERLMIDDVAGAAAVTLAILAPLPNISVTRLRDRVDERLWEVQLAALDPRSEWWERTTAALWLGMIEATQEFKLPINLTVLRLTRATLQYDTLACRLDPDANVLSAFKGWQRGAARRALRRERDRLAPWSERQARGQLVDDLSRLGEALRRGSFWVSQISRSAPRDFVPLAHLSAALGSAILHLGLFLTGIGIVTVLGGLVWGRLTGMQVELMDLAWRVLTLPPVVALSVVLSIQQIGALRRRLSARQT